MDEGSRLVKQALKYLMIGALSFLAVTFLERLEASGILSKPNPYAVVKHLAELVKHPQNLGSRRVMLLNCFDRPHNLFPTIRFFWAREVNESNDPTS